MPMNILYYCNEYPPYPTGGIGSVTKIVAEEFARRGDNVYVVGYYDDIRDLPYYSEINGVKIYRLHKKFRDRNGRICNFFIRKMYKCGVRRPIIQYELDYTESYIIDFIKKNRIDIFEITDFYHFNEKSPNLKYHGFPVPTVLRIHGCVSFLKNLSGKPCEAVRRNDQRHFGRCDYLSAVSRYSLAYIKENFDTAFFKKEVIICNPIETDFLGNLQEINSNKILFIGKLKESKGCFSFLEAFSRCAMKHHEITARVIGGGNVDEAMRYLAPEVANRVKFLGFCDRETIKKEIDECAFACIPTYFETFGMVALEIMARSRALIFTERTSGAEIVENGVNGFTVNPENVEQIVEKMEILISDDKLRHRFSKNGFDTVRRKFLSTVIVDQLSEFYTNILNG